MNERFFKIGDKVQTTNEFVEVMHLDKGFISTISFIANRLCYLKNGKMLDEYWIKHHVNIEPSKFNK